MKKFYVLIVMVLFSGFIFAQSLNQIRGSQILNSKLKVEKPEAALNHINASDLNIKKGKGNSDGYRWYNYATQMQYVNYPNGNSDNLFSGFLFPDTLINFHYSDGDGYPNYHSLAVILDPYDFIFQDDTMMNIHLMKQGGKYHRNYNYTIDSVALFYVYVRNINDASIKDTLEVEFISNFGGPVNGFIGQKTNWGYDTTWFAQLTTDNFLDYSFTQTDPPITAPSVQRVKIPLGTADSSKIHANGTVNIKVKIVPANLPTATGDNPLAYGNGLCAATFRFIPGYQYSPILDTLNAVIPGNGSNYFEFLAYMENGKDETAYPRYNPNFFNISEFLTTQSLRPTQGWLDTYIPRVAYGLGMYDNIIASFGLHVDNLGITQNAEKNISLSQNIPNPAANSTIIPYELKGTNNVTFVITDLTGNKVMEINKGKQMAGSYTLDLSTENLSSGMYFYTLNAGNTKLTRKMIINK
jgi:hypothetical protein